MAGVRSWSGTLVIVVVSGQTILTAMLLKIDMTCVTLKFR